MKKRPAIPQFIKEERRKGSTDQEIRHKLLEAGWQIDIINKALNPKLKEKNTKTGESSTVKKSLTKKPDYRFFLIGLVFILLILGALFI